MEDDGHILPAKKKRRSMNTANNAAEIPVIFDNDASLKPNNIEYHITFAG
jgi:hypothetical protein